MMKLIRALALLALTVAPAAAQQMQLGAGHVIANVGSSPARGGDTVFSAVMDKNFGSTRGSIAERGASGWSAITPGTAGLPLVSNGSGADPSYQIVPLTGGGTGAAITGTSGAVPYFSSSSTMGTSAALTNFGPVIGGGAGNPPSTVAAGSNNQAFMGNTAGAPVFRALTGTDLPFPGASSLGGIESVTCNTHTWLDVISTAGVPTCAQPSFTDLTGTASLAQGGLGSSQSAATANQIPVFTGSGGAAVPTSAASWAANAWCNTVGYIYTMVTGGWACAQGIPANIVWFGAVPDTTTGHATVNYNAFVNALATGATVLVPYNSAGYNIGTNVIALTSGQNVACDGVQKTPIYGTGSAIFSITSAGPPVVVKGCLLDMQGAAPGTAAILLNTAAGAVVQVTVRDVECLWTYGCVVDNGTNTASVVTLDNVYAVQTEGLQFSISHSNGFIFLNNIQCNFTNESGIGLVSWGCGSFTNFAGLRISGLSAATGYGVGTPAFSSIYAWNFSSGQALWIDTLFADTTIGNGINVQGVTFLWAKDIEGSLNLGYQVNIINVTDGNIANMQCYGAKGLTGAAGASAGCQILGSTGLNVANVFSTSATGDAFLVSGASTGVNVANVVGLNSTGGGIDIASSADYVHINNGYVSGNGSTVLNSSTGTHNVIKNIGGYNPVGLTAGTSTGTSGTSICAGPSPETHYITQSATFNAAVKSGSTTLCTVATATVPCVIDLGPNECYSVAGWSTTQPTYSKFVH